MLHEQVPLLLFISSTSARTTAGSLALMFVTLATRQHSRRPFDRYTVLARSGLASTTSFPFHYNALPLYPFRASRA